MSQAESSEVQDVVPKVSILTRLRLPLIITGAVLGAFVFLLIGLGLGKTKLSLERKQFAEKVVLFNEQLQVRENDIKIFEQKAENLKKMHEQQKTRADELEKKLEDTAQLLLKAQEAVASATASVSASPSKVDSSPKAKQYLRFGNVDCTVGTQLNNDDWKACLQQGRVKDATPAKTVQSKPKAVH